MNPLPFLLVLAFLASPLAAPGAIVQTVSARRLEGKLIAITADGTVEFLSSGKKLLFPLRTVHRIRLSDRTPTPDTSANVEVRTVNGSKLYGILAPPRDALTVTCPALGQALRFKADDLLGVRFVRPKEAELTRERFLRTLARPGRDRDLLFVASPKGVLPFSVAVESVAPHKTFFTFKGENRAIATGKVAAVVFANRPADEAAPVTVRLTDASVVRGTRVEFSGGKLSLDLAGTKVLLSAAGIVSIEFANPNIAYLSDLVPVSVEEIPFFNHVWKHRLDRSISGGPLTLDGRRYERGIGCHTRTALTYDLGGRYKWFAAVVGIDDEARPRGSVEFIVRADGKLLKSLILTGRQSSVPIALDISGVQRLTLVTDFAEDASVGDHADWADARVMK